MDIAFAKSVVEEEESLTDVTEHNLKLFEIWPTYHETGKVEIDVKLCRWQRRGSQPLENIDQSYYNRQGYQSSIDAQENVRPQSIRSQQGKST